jgi:cell pole-organizing protein PopZ
MTQPAKVQEPSMEEILASIRRIIADDEAKPAEKAAAPAKSGSSESGSAAPPAAKPAVMSDIPSSAVAAARPAKPAAPAPNPPAASNSQDDIDAMLAGFDAATSEAEVRPPLPDGEVFELTDDMALPDPPPAPFRKVEPEDDIEFSEAAATGAPPRPQPAQHRQPAFEPPPLYESPVAPPQQILSRSTVSAVESAFNTLANTVLNNNARTLEDLVKEMLRPMLKSWLDDNLPGLVERIVKAEIERVSRGR